MATRKSSSPADISGNIEAMKNVMCRLLGHQQYEAEVLAIRPWEDPEFYGYDIADFREDRCLRCGEALPREPQAA